MRCVYAWWLYGQYRTLAESRGLKQPTSQRRLRLSTRAAIRVAVVPEKRYGESDKAELKAAKSEADLAASRANESEEELREWKRRYKSVEKAHDEKVKTMEAEITKLQMQHAAGSSTRTFEYSLDLRGASASLW